jgi:asparagine synthase (glutamine-hydrolysing)
MCGIAGIYMPDGSQPKSADLQKMTRMLTHRGPDEEGFYAAVGIGLGHKRLSIIDLSGGQQPMHNEDRSVWTIFNGEIFNYIELRETLVKKGHTFYSHSDTEVIVHLYEEYGVDFASHLNGQFSIAVWDISRRRLVLTRDRVGIRPLFYSRRPDGTIPAWNVKSIPLDWPKRPCSG